MNNLCSFITEVAPLLSLESPLSLLLPFPLCMLSWAGWVPWWHYGVTMMSPIAAPALSHPCCDTPGFMIAVSWPTSQSLLGVLWIAHGSALIITFLCRRWLMRAGKPVFKTCCCSEAGPRQQWKSYPNWYSSSAGYSLSSKGKTPWWCTAYAQAAQYPCVLCKDHFIGSESFLGHECSRTTVSQMHFTEVAKSLVLKHHTVYLKNHSLIPFYLMD